MSELYDLQGISHKILRHFFWNFDFKNVLDKIYRGKESW